MKETVKTTIDPNTQVRKCPYKINTQKNIDYGVGGKRSKENTSSEFGFCELHNCPFYVNNSFCWCNRG